MNLHDSKSACAMALVLSALLPWQPAAAEPETQDPVRLAVSSATDADFITHLLGSVLKKAGYNVSYVRSDYTAQFTAIEFGDVDASAAIWSSSPELIAAAVDSGYVSQVGSTGITITETWWYPSYVAELCPGLPDWTALKDPACIKALSNPETDGKINYLGTQADFDSDDERRIEALGLDVHVTLPGTMAAMVATMEGAIEKKKPIIGFGFVPHWLYGSDKGSFIQFPPYEEACRTDPAWGINPDLMGDCALPDGDIIKLVNNDFAERVPGAMKVLGNFKLTNDDVAWGIVRQEKDGLTAEAAAAEWIAKNEAVWAPWL